MFHGALGKGQKFVFGYKILSFNLIHEKQVGEANKIHGYSMCRTLKKGLILAFLKLSNNGKMTWWILLKGKNLAKIQEFRVLEFSCGRFFDFRGKAQISDKEQ